MDLEGYGNTEADLSGPPSTLDEMTDWVRRQVASGIGWFGSTFGLEADMAKTHSDIQKWGRPMADAYGAVPQSGSNQPNGGFLGGVGGAWKKLVFWVNTTDSESQFVPRDSSDESNSADDIRQARSDQKAAFIHDTEARAKNATRYLARDPVNLVDQAAHGDPVSIAIVAATIGGGKLVDNVVEHAPKGKVTEFVGKLWKWVRGGEKVVEKEAVVAAEATEFTHVGRWMSQAEHDAMIATGRVQESTSLRGVTSVTTPPDAATWARQTDGTVFVEFDVPKSALRGGGSKIYGPNSIFGPKLNITEMPPALNIEIKASKWPQ